MSNPFAVYRLADGLVLRTGTAGDPDHIPLQAQTGETVDGNPPANVIADGLWQWTATGYVHNAPPAPTLDKSKQAKLADLANIAAPILSTWAAGNLQVDDVSTGRMTSWGALAIVSIQSSTAFNLPYWIMADNSHRTFAGAADFLTFVQAAAGYRTAALLRNSQLKIAIQGAADVAGLAAIDITQGWPT